MIISRFAPTPSGFLHHGNALNFILTWTLVRVAEGKIHLRIDDLDTDRTKTLYVEHIFRVLEWLGLDWDEGPFSVAEFETAFALKHRLAYYEEAKQTLLKHPLAYACECSRKEIMAQSSKGIYPFTCKEKNLPLHVNTTALRVHVNPAVCEEAPRVAKEMGDFIVWRKEGLPAYQLASLMDDWRMGTTLIVRGEDLHLSTLAQRYLAHLMRAPSFLEAKVLHHPLLLDEAGEKLSKSARSSPVEFASSPAPLYRHASMLLGVFPCENAIDLCGALLQKEESPLSAFFL